MKISKITIKNLKKIAHLDVQIPESNRVICFVGENGSNKSSVLTYLYQMIRRTTQEKSPSDTTDLFYQTTADVSHDAKESYYFVKASLTFKEKEYITSEASLINFSTISDETKLNLKQEFPYTYKEDNNFLQHWWGIQTPYHAEDIVKENVLLFRPSNRFERPSNEVPLEESTTKMPLTSNISGYRKFPFRVESGIEKANSYLLDVLLDYFIAMNNKIPSYSLYEDFMSVLRSIDPDFHRLTISSFPNKVISCKNLPSLAALSSGQSEW